MKVFRCAKARELIEEAVALENYVAKYIGNTGSANDYGDELLKTAAGIRKTALTMECDYICSDYGI